MHSIAPLQAGNWSRSRCQCPGLSYTGFVQVRHLQDRGLRTLVDMHWLLLFNACGRAPMQGQAEWPGASLFSKELPMTPNDDKNKTKPVADGGMNPADKPHEGGELQENLQRQPEQPGAEFGGYGQADHAFGRDAGSSSEEGGQGGGGESAGNAETVPRTRRGGSDGASQTRHSSSSNRQPHTSPAADQAASPAARQQGSDMPDQNHQNQGGQGNR